MSSKRPRRAVRDLRNRPTQKDEETEADREEHITEDEYRESSPPPKRAKTSNRKKANTQAKAPSRRRAGKLAKVLTSMPFDIFIEITSHLLPLDLLRLSRTSKYLRSFFMSRKARTMWIDAFSNIPKLPPCPEDLCEPEYASLLFDKFCMTCEARTSCRTDYRLRMRVCKPCYKPCQTTGLRRLTRFISGAELGIPEEMIGCFVILIDDADHLTTFLLRTRDIFKQLLYLKHNATKEEYESTLEKQKIRASSTVELGILLNSWREEEEEERYLEIEKMKMHREIDIHTLLVLRGYKYQDFPYNDPNWQRLVCQPKPLTDRIWRNIEQQLIELVEYRRNARIESEALEDRKSSLIALYNAFVVPRMEDQRLLPSPEEFLRFKSLGESVWTERLSDHDLAMLFSKALFDIIDESIAFRRDRRKEVAEMILNAHTRVGERPPATRDMLEDEGICMQVLSIEGVEFGCSECGFCIWTYETALEHEHARNFRWGSVELALITVLRQ